MDKAESIYKLMNEIHPFPYVEGGITTFAKSPTAQKMSGFVYIRPLGHNEADIIYIGVLPKFRRQGVAQGLIRALQKEYQKLYLEVETTNQAAHALYQSLGFTPQRTRPDYYGSGRDALDMVWSTHHVS